MTEGSILHTKSCVMMNTHQIYQLGQQLCPEVRVTTAKMMQPSQLSRPNRKSLKDLTTMSQSKNGEFHFSKPIYQIIQYPKS